jgi:imidazolonepropionase-like amidohydrolase
MQWAIKTPRLFDGTGSPLVRDALLVIENERIVAVGPAAQVALPAGVSVLDVGDRTVMPGLIDAHVHILWSGSVASGQESRVATDCVPRTCASRVHTLGISGRTATRRSAACTPLV